MLLWRRLFLPNRCVSFPPVSHVSKEEEEGLAFTSLTDDEDIPEESMPCGSWTPHLLTSEDGIPENLKMSRHETTTCDSEDHSPPASLEAASRGGADTQKSSCGSLQLDLTYINAVKHLLGQDGFEPIQDTVQEQLQSLRANRQTDAHQSQWSVKAHREAGPTVTSEKGDVQVRVKGDVSFETSSKILYCTGHLSLILCHALSFVTLVMNHTDTVIHHLVRLASTLVPSCHAPVCHMSLVILHVSCHNLSGVTSSAVCRSLGCPLAAGRR